MALGYLVVQPVRTVKELPRSARRARSIYIEGSHNADNGKQWMRKKQLFIEGSSVALNEDELNAWIAPKPRRPRPRSPPPGPKGAKAGGRPPPIIELGTPNFRIHDGMLQIGSKGTLNLDWLGIKQTIIVQATGRFVKKGGGFGLRTRPILYRLLSGAPAAWRWAARCLDSPAGQGEDARGYCGRVEEACRRLRSRTTR